MWARLLRIPPPTRSSSSIRPGVFLYNPSGAAGAAGDNGGYGAWHRLCTSGLCSGRAGLVTSAGTFLVGSGAGAARLSRGTDRGRTWALNYEDYGAEPFFEATVPSASGPDGTAVFIGVGDGGESARSLHDGAPGTWEPAGTGFGFPQSFGEVPPSPALPQGRLLYGVWNGILTSDDGGLSYQPSSAFGSARYIAWSFTFRAEAGHPYGGVAYAGVQNLNAAEDGGEFRGSEVLRSDDGGSTWARAHRFSVAEIEVPVPSGTDMTRVMVLATPDGALWAGVSQSGGATNPRHGGIMRSADGGATWARADAGYRNAEGWGYGANQLKLSRTGVLYAATDRGVWRTTAPVVAVAGEAPPAALPEVSVSVRPNPAGGRVEVALNAAEANVVRVVVLDALGREVAVVHDGAVAQGERVVSVETGGWPAGVYVVRASVGAQMATARLVVAR